MPQDNHAADVTVVVVTRNHQEHVVECLESIRTQQGTRVQVVIVDDGSTDQTLARVGDYLSAYPDFATLGVSRLTRGWSSHVSAALRACTTEFFTALPPDAVMQPWRLARQVEQLRAEPLAALSYSDVLVRDAESSGLAPTGATEFPWPADPDVLTHPFGELLKRNWIFGASLLLRTRTLRLEGGVRKASSGEDLELLVRLSKDHPFAWDPTPLVSVRPSRHGPPSLGLLPRQALLQSLDHALRHYEGSAPELEALAREKRWELAKGAIGAGLPARESLRLLWGSRSGASTRAAVARQLWRWLRAV